MLRLNCFHSRINNYSHRMRFPTIVPNRWLLRECSQILAMRFRFYRAPGLVSKKFRQNLGIYRMSHFWNNIRTISRQTTSLLCCATAICGQIIFYTNMMPIGIRSIYVWWVFWMNLYEHWPIDSLHAARSTLHFASSYRRAMICVCFCTAHLTWK